jgi:[acyl-carrier-protein] S-malonyltransferase
LLGVTRQAVESLCAELSGGGVLQPANYNDPGQIVIAGETVRVQAAIDAVKARRLGKPVLLKVSAPFHCRMLQPAAERLARAFAQVTFHPFTVPVLSNVTAAPILRPKRCRISWCNRCVPRCAGKTPCTMPPPTAVTHSLKWDQAGRFLV